MVEGPLTRAPGIQTMDCGATWSSGAIGSCCTVRSSAMKGEKLMPPTRVQSSAALTLCRTPCAANI